MRKTKDSGFTLIELLVVVIIIGLLAGVLLISVRSAINKARDARITAALGQVRTRAEIYFDNQVPPTYVGLNNDSTVTTAGTDISSNGGSILWGQCTNAGYVVWSVLSSDNTKAFCVDGFAGKAGKVVLNLLTAGGCGNVGSASCPGL